VRLEFRPTFRGPLKRGKLGAGRPFGAGFGVCKTQSHSFLKQTSSDSLIRTRRSDFYCLHDQVCARVAFAGG
jgi:hypothetical protein